MKARIDELIDAWGNEPFDLGKPLPKTREGCADETMQLDAIIGAIDGQIAFARANLQVMGGTIDPRWLQRAIGALHLHKARRNRVNTHMGTITKALKHEQQNRLSQVFMNAAMQVLPEEQKRAVWDRIAILAPDLVREEKAA